MRRALFTICILCLVASQAGAQDTGSEFTSVQSDSHSPLTTELDPRCPNNSELTDCSKAWATKPYGAAEYKPRSSMGAINFQDQLNRLRRYSQSPSPLTSLFGYAGIYELAEVFEPADETSTIRGQAISAIKRASEKLTVIQPGELAPYCVSIHELASLNQDPAVKELTMKVIAKVDGNHMASEDMYLLLLLANDYKKAGDKETARSIEEVVDRYKATVTPEHF